MIVATVVVTCMAFLYRRFKLRMLFFTAAALSIAGSAMGLFAGSFAVLLVARLVQAVGTGIFIPLMMNTILAVTPKNRLGVVHVHRRVHDHVRAGLRPGGVRGARDGVRLAQHLRRARGGHGGCSRSWVSSS